MNFFCLLSLIFAWTALSGFQSTETLIFAQVTLCGFSTYRAVLLSFLDKVFLDCISIHRMWEFITIHGCKSHGAARKCSFDNIRAFVIRRPFAPRIWLKRQYFFKHEVAFLKFTRSNLFVEGLFHPCLV